jgi:hypothetical protein
MSKDYEIVVTTVDGVQTATVVKKEKVQDVPTEQKTENKKSK